jgi:spore coat polysaccharide biosynthesis protein SpsF
VLWVAPRPVVAIIQARMGSTRLPGKVLAEVAGRPLLAHMLERVALARSLDAVWVATSDAPADDAIVRLAETEGVPVFRGSEPDVLGRYAGAANAAGARTVVRLTADCPLLAPEVIDRVVAAFGEGGHDIASNTGAEWRTYPDGMDVEVLARDTLDQLAATVENPMLREHVTARLYSGDYSLREVHLDRPLGDLRITVDTSQDLALVSRVLRARPGYALDDVLTWLGA